MRLRLHCLMMPLVLVALATGAAPSPVLAQDAADSTPAAANEAAARTLFERGIALSDAGQFTEALETFRRSLALADRASSLLNVGLMLFRTGKPVESVEVLQQYLARADVRDDEGRRTKGEQALHASRTAVARLELDVSPTNAQANINGVLQPGQGAERVYSLNPGQHTIAVSAEGFTPRERRITLLSGQILSLGVELQPVAPPTENIAQLNEPVARPLQLAAAPEPAEESGGVVTKWWFWTVIGVAVAGAAVGTYFAIDAASPDGVGGNGEVLLAR